MSNQFVYRLVEGHLVIERDASSVSPDAERNARTAPVELAPGEPPRLHVFLDHSVIEIFTNHGRTCLASRVYPLRPDSLGVGLFVWESSVKVKSLASGRWTQSEPEEQEVARGAGKAEVSDK